jgi:hypothetical protein
MLQIPAAALLGTVLSLTIGCTSPSNTTSTTGLNGSQSSAFFTELSVANANSEQCPAGGKVYSLFIDSNLNGVEDPTELPLTQQIVCNGQNGAQGIQGVAGADGFNALIATNRVTTAFDSCPSNSGLQISYGLDSDRDGFLSPSEITHTTLLCDGQNGQVGSAGPAGSNGHSVVFASVPAPVEVCPAGGVTTLLALDINDIHVYSPLDPNQSSMTICNGQNGAAGQAGENAVLGAYTPVDAIMPCGNTVAEKEVLLRLNNGQVLASFSDDVNGKNTRFSFLPDGSYIDTDDSNCNFSISTSGSTRSASWFGQVQMSWPIQ